MAICIVTVPEAPAATSTVVGFDRHSAFFGSAPHPKLKVPPGENSVEETHLGVTDSVKLAVWPLATVWLVEPTAARAKSELMPDSRMLAGSSTALELTPTCPVYEP